MKIISFGSLNIDRVYRVRRIVESGETIQAEGQSVFAGGKGLNQSVAAARAGAEVIHAGAIGSDGEFLARLLEESGADASLIMRKDEPSGHAIIQVDENGQNAIIVYGGTNHSLSDEYIESMLDLGDKGDIVLLQNEVNGVAQIIRSAHRRGLKTVWNPSPFPDSLEEYPLQMVSAFIVNEREGKALCSAPDASADEALRLLGEHYPGAQIVMTLGQDGAVCRWNGKEYRHGAYRVRAIDTTAAGDTFCGYFLAGLCRGEPIGECLEAAAAASAIAVSRQGAAPSIPARAEVEEFLAQRRAGC